ncbi:MAG TPA: PQQ-binding-like beta-propeller repeat protein [Thermoguttaceae bacterium]|nr:PQQ-binding-like beta-propeller repeat protein [Thermoguttaceae bacterium]
MIWCRPLLLIGVCSAWPALAQTPPAAPNEPAASQIEALVERLGDDSYEARQRASQDLAALGLKARDALHAGLKHADAEVRRRCRWILQDVLETDFQNRLKAFLADKEGKRQHDLPGWERYRQTIGEDQSARELFAQMLKEEAPLLISSATGAEPAAEGLMLRISQVYSSMVVPYQQQRREPSLATSAALLFVSSDPESNLPQELLDHSCLATLAQRPAFTEALTQGPHQAAARKLLGRWIILPTGINVLDTKLRLAMQYDLQEGLALALRAMRKKEAHSHSRVYGVMALGQLGGKPYAAVLAQSLADKSEIGRRTVNGKSMSIELRDVVLAWLIHVTGQSHADYGLAQAGEEFKRMAENKNRHMSTTYCAFDDEAAREKALEKWKTYVEKSPLPDPPEEPVAETAETPAKPPARPAVAINPLVPGFGLPGMGGIDAEATEEEPDDDALPPAEHQLVRKLALARELAESRRYAEAAWLLGEILRAGEDCEFRPDVGEPHYCRLLAAAEQLLGSLGNEAHDAYKLRFESLARSALEKAIAAGNTEALAEVTSRFFYTDAGAEATYLLAADHINRGHPLHAALFLQRLEQRPDDAAGRFQPALSVMLAACWSRAGKPRAAEEVLLRVQARFPDATVLIGGEQRAMFTRPEDALGWLESLVGPSRKPEDEQGWPMFGGDPTRCASADAGSPFLRAELLSDLSGQKWFAEIARKMHREYLDEHRVALPRLHPLVVGESIVLRSATDLKALDFDTGQLQWESPLDDPLRHFIRSENRPQGAADEASFSTGLRRRLLGDATFGTVSSDGYFVFAIEDLHFAFHEDCQRLVVMPDGRRRLDPGLLKRHNLLTAHDLQTGKVRWEIGGPSNVEGVRQPDTFFLGPPLPLGGRLYVPAEVGTQTTLLELDAETGETIGRLTLAEEDRQRPIPISWMTSLLWLARSSRAHGLSPSYADGVLICCTPDQQVVAVDLATWTRRWSYRVPMREPTTLDANARFAMMNGFYRPEPPDLPDRWADAAATIAEGRLLLTLPNADELVCLNLADGRLRWSLERGDGLYVGGVDRGRVVVVGCGSVRAVKLADGTDAWPPVALPPEALPSGRGFLGKGRYHLPLSTAEVATIDLHAGRLLARSRSPDGIIPGNLVALGDSVLSQHVDGVRHFQPLSQREQDLATALQRRPDDAGALADYAEILLCQGRIGEGVEHLRRALDIQPTPRARELLAHAMTEGLRVDRAAFRELSGQVESWIDRPETQARFLRELAAAHQQAGDISAATDAYLKLIALGEPAGGNELEHFGASWVARRDRWVQARLAELHAAAEPSRRAEIDRKIPSGPEDDRLQTLLSFFAWHPAAHEARLRLAEQSIEKKEWLPAEQLLRCVLDSADASQRHAAVAHLAELLRKAGDPDEAARFYGHLNAELAEADCLDGKTGRELLDALPPDDPIRRRLAPPEPWPAKVRVETDDNRTGISPPRSMTVFRSGGPFAGDDLVEMDMQGNVLTVRDTLGRQRWQTNLQEKQAAQQTIFWGFGGSRYGEAEAWLRGRLLVVRRDDRVVAVDGFAQSGKMLWDNTPPVPDPSAPRVPVFVGVAGRRPQAKALPASDRLSLAAADTGVCFQQQRRLLCVDPLSGEVLWTRDDLPAECDLFGDRERVFVTPSESEEARVFSMLDGRDLGRRRVPPLEDRMWTLGRKVLTWEKTDDETRLTLVDPWAGEDLWQRRFDAGAQPWLVAEDEVAVLEPQGNFTTAALPEGETRLSATVDPSPSLLDAIVLRCADRYVLIANRTIAKARPMISLPYPTPLPVNGRVYGFDRKTGKRLWATDVSDQALDVDQPAELPVLFFFGGFQKQEEDRITSLMSMLCLDKRSGKVLHRKESTGGGASTYQIQADPEEHRIEIRSYLGTVKLSFE